MEFLHAKNEPTAPIDAIRVNWYYRPRDIQRKVTDTRVVFALDALGHVPVDFFAR